jgi:hypothetical protein
MDQSRQEGARPEADAETPQPHQPPQPTAGQGREEGGAS